MEAFRYALQIEAIWLPIATAMFGPASGVSADVSLAAGATAASGRGVSSLHAATRASARTPAAATNWCVRMGRGSNRKEMRRRTATEPFGDRAANHEPPFSGWAVSERPRALRTGLAAGVPFSRGQRERSA